MKDNNFFPITHARSIALYGSRPYSKLDEHEIEQALTVKGNVIQVREVNKGDYCGYSLHLKQRMIIHILQLLILAMVMVFKNVQHTKH